MSEKRTARVCPVELAGHLDSRIRRWLQNPREILSPYVRPGMTALDVGCGPGFFTIDMARLVGPSGRVIAADLQDGMLQKVAEKVRGTELEDRITLHRCTPGRIGAAGDIDFVLLFYMVHEVPDQQALFEEIRAFLTPGGQVLVVEPPFHVSRSAFQNTLELAGESGFRAARGPRVLLSKTAILEK